MSLDTKITFDSSSYVLQTCTNRCNIITYLNSILVKSGVHSFVNGLLPVIQFEKSYIVYLEILKQEFKLYDVLFGKRRPMHA